MNHKRSIIMMIQKIQKISRRIQKKKKNILKNTMTNKEDRKEYLRLYRIIEYVTSKRRTYNYIYLRLA